MAYLQNVRLCLRRLDRDFWSAGRRRRTSRCRPAPRLRRYGRCSGLRGRSGRSYSVRFSHLHEAGVDVVGGRRRRINCRLISATEQPQHEVGDQADSENERNSPKVSHYALKLKLLDNLFYNLLKHFSNYLNYFIYLILINCMLFLIQLKLCI